MKKYRRPLVLDSSVPTKISLSLFFWDFLVMGLILMPLITGGFYGRWWGIYFEIAELGSLTLITSAVGLILQYGFQIPLRNSLTSQLFLHLWNWWCGKLEKFPLRTLTIAHLGVGALWSHISIQRHHSLHTSAYDTGIFLNTLWNLIHGHGYLCAPKGGINLFTDHQSFTFVLFAPLFALYQKAETLFILQALFLASGAIPLYFLGRQYLSKNEWQIAATLPLLYWSYLPLRNANAFEFHPEIVLLPLFLAAIACFQSVSRKNRWVGILFLVLALGGKESAGPVACGVGLAWVLGAGPLGTRSFTRKLGWGVITSGIGMFFFDFAVMPRWLEYSYSYLSAYGNKSASVSDLALAWFQHPIETLNAFFESQRRIYLFRLLLPFGFLPLFYPKALVAALPGLAMLFMTQGNARIHLQFHYAIEPAIGLFWAFPAALGRFSKLLGRKLPQLPLPQFVLGWILFWGLGGAEYSEFLRLQSFPITEHAQWVRQQVVPCLHPSLSFAVSDPWVPHLSQRRWIHSLDQITTDQRLPVACIAEDQQDSTGATQLPTEFQQTLRRLNYTQIYQCGSTRVYQHESQTSESCLVCVPACDLIK